MFNMKDLHGQGFLQERTKNCLDTYVVLDNYDLCFDIGVNVGGFINAYYDKFKKIVGLEAHPLTYEFAKKNLSSHNNVLLLNNGAYHSDDEELNLFIFENENSGSTSILNSIPNSQYKDKSNTTKSISYETLVKKYGTPQYIKIDIEGGEYDFLFGKDLSGVEFLSMELHTNFLSEEKRKDLKNHLLKFFNIYSEKQGKYHPEINFIKK